MMMTLQNVVPKLYSPSSDLNVISYARLSAAVHSFSPNLRAGVSLYDSTENRSAELLIGGLLVRETM
jgi:hypothetical protein